MKSFESSCETFVIAPQPSESREPSEAAFDHPPSGKQDKAFPGLLKFDHLKFDTMALGIFGGLLSCIALINPGVLNILTGSLLGGLSKLFDFTVIP